MKWKQQKSEHLFSRYFARNVQKIHILFKSSEADIPITSEAIFLVFNHLAFSNLSIGPDFMQ